MKRDFVLDPAGSLRTRRMSSLGEPGGCRGWTRRLLANPADPCEPAVWLEPRPEGTTDRRLRLRSCLGECRLRETSIGGRPDRASTSGRRWRDKRVAGGWRPRRRQGPRQGHDGYNGYMAGDTIGDHDHALSYVMEYFPELLPSFAGLGCELSQGAAPGHLFWRSVGDAGSGTNSNSFGRTRTNLVLGRIWLKFGRARPSLGRTRP